MNWLRKKTVQLVGHFCVVVKRELPSPGLEKPVGRGNRGNTGGNDPQFPAGAWNGPSNSGGGPTWEVGLFHGGRGIRGWLRSFLAGFSKSKKKKGGALAEQPPARRAAARRIRPGPAVMGKLRGQGPAVNFPLGFSPAARQGAGLAHSGGVATGRTHRPFTG